MIWRIFIGIFAVSYGCVYAYGSPLNQTQTHVPNISSSSSSSGAVAVTPVTPVTPVTTDASELAHAQRLFDQGEYEKALILAEKIGTSDAPYMNASQAYVLASEALSVQIFLGYFDKPNASSIKARRLAENAIKLDGNNLDATFQYLVAFGLETQSSGVLKAWRKKLPTRMRAAIETAQIQAPNDPRGYALLGAWHLGIVNKVGAKNAYNWYKASPDMGQVLYEKALGLARDDIIITSNYAASMILLGHQKYANELLRRVSNMSASNAAETAIKLRMETLLSLYDKPEKLKRAAKQFLNNEPV